MAPNGSKQSAETPPGAAPCAPRTRLCAQGWGLMRMAGLQGLSQAEVDLRVLKLGVRLKGLASAVKDAIKVAFAPPPVLTGHVSSFPPY
jgi:hypothetical protein